jgi:DNA-binding CsgD family transcriptional regulator
MNDRGGEYLITQLRLIADGFSEAQSLESAIQGLALNVCFSGSASRVYLGKFSNNLELVHEMSFGFETEIKDSDKYRDFLSSELLPLSITKSEITIMDHNKDYLEKFESHVGVMESSIWRSTVLVPLVPSYFLSLSVQVELTRNETTKDYFNAVFAIFNLFLRSNRSLPESDIQVSQRTSRRIETSELTERQSMILKMIQSGDTNQIIAARMGYSESLIRQETISIYRKLGISGRRDLTIEPR